MAGSPTPIPAQPSPPPDAEFLLRINVEEALPPLARFPSTPAYVITLDRRVLTAGAVPAMFPGPLVMPIVERQLTPTGWARIVAAAREAGLLSGISMIGQPMPGEGILRVRLFADVVLHDIGTPNTSPACLSEPCQGAPGTREAMEWFISRLADLGNWLGDDVAAEAAHVPEGYAIVVGPIPDDQGLPQPSIDWPFDAGFAGFGHAFADGSGFRCGMIIGGDAEILRATLGRATSITRWRDPIVGSFHGLTVKPLLPGDGDACGGLV